MIEPIRDLPENVLGFRAKGTVTGADYETVIIPAVEAKLSKHPKVRLLYQLGEEFTGFDAGAMWDDAKIGLKHLGAWDRIAVVTDVDWVRAAVKVFGYMLRGHLRLFHNREFDAARKWVSES